MHGRLLGNEVVYLLTCGISFLLGSVFLHLLKLCWLIAGGCIALEGGSECVHRLAQLLSGKYLRYYISPEEKFPSSTVCGYISNIQGG